MVILENGDFKKAFLISASEREDLVDARWRNQAVTRWEAWNGGGEETPYAGCSRDDR